MCSTHIQTDFQTILCSRTAVLCIRRAYRIVCASLNCSAQDSARYFEAVVTDCMQKHTSRYLKTTPQNTYIGYELCRPRRILHMHEKFINTLCFWRCVLPTQAIEKYFAMIIKFDIPPTHLIYIILIIFSWMHRFRVCLLNDVYVNVKRPSNEKHWYCLMRWLIYEYNEAKYYYPM